MKKVRIGNSSGFWGDEPRAMDRQVRLGNLDYLTADYLAEVSMSILAKQQAKSPEAGFVTDFIDHISLSVKSLKKYFPKIVTNAGGNNPIGCAKKLQNILSANGFHKKVMVVTGDNLIYHVSHLLNRGDTFENMETGKSFGSIQGQLRTVNAYTSAEGIEKALSMGADIVICGRASDSALAIGPIKFEMGWQSDDWDLLASAMVAGHLIECGAQATGGNFTDWESVPKWEEIGYPIVEMYEDGSFNVTKAEGTGGLVNQWTVKEQLVYEIGDPQQYMGPDVIADLTTLDIRDAKPNVVSINGVKGRPAPETWKVSMAFHDGFKASGMVVVGGEKAFKKAQLLERIFWKRLPSFKKVSTNFIGATALGDTLAQLNAKEILLQFTAFDDNPDKLVAFSKEVAGLILSGPQGLAAFGGRPKIQEVIAYWPSLVDKAHLELTIWQVDQKGNESKVVSFNPSSHSNPSSSDPLKPTANIEVSESIINESDLVEIPLSRLCLARSGDKGNSTNLGVLARSAEVYDHLKQILTEQLIKEWFSDICMGEVRRYELTNLLALNFVLHEALDGGGTRSGRLDPQGKMVASAFLARKILVPKPVIARIDLMD